LVGKNGLPLCRSAAACTEAARVACGELFRAALLPLLATAIVAEKKRWIAIDKGEKESKIGVSLELRAKKINSRLANCREFLGIFRHLAVSKGLKK
jgi:hypothetical protein